MITKKTAKKLQLPELYSVFMMLVIFAWWLKRTVAWSKLVTVEKHVKDWSLNVQRILKYYISILGEMSMK